MTIVAILSVRAQLLDEFRAYEQQAASLMTRYGGRLERVIVVASSPPGDLTREVHVVTFPDGEAFERYRSDETLAALAEVRGRCVTHTELLIGEEGPDYNAPGRE